MFFSFVFLIFLRCPAFPLHSCSLFFHSLFVIMFVLLILVPLRVLILFLIRFHIVVRILNLALILVLALLLVHFVPTVRLVLFLPQSRFLCPSVFILCTSQKSKFFHNFSLLRFKLKAKLKLLDEYDTHLYLLGVFQRNRKFSSNRFRDIWLACCTRKLSLLQRKAREQLDPHKYP